jgi:glycosyltransferase involved in cell wall biosynthesis
MDASVIVRARNEESTIRDTLICVRGQTVDSEIIVVDSGSTDSTALIASQYCDRLISIPKGEFTYGSSLNVGASVARGRILFSLSAHCVPASRHWLEWSLDAYRDEAVGGTHGDAYGPDGQPLHTPILAGVHELALDLTWGFSNHASSWRRDIWEEFPFNERLAACEDKEWMWRICLAGWKLMVDPRLSVATSHRRAAGPRRLAARVYREHRSLAQFLDFSPMPYSRLFNLWWSSFPRYSPSPRWKRRLSPLRTVELLGALAGDHVGARHRFPDAIKITRG